MFECYRFACAVPSCRTADLAYNTSEISKLYNEAAESGASVVLFPALAVTGDACGDLFDIPSFAASVEEEVEKLAASTAGKSTIMVVGTIWRDAGKCVEAAAVIADGEILEVVTGSNVVFTNGTAGFGVSVGREPFAPAEPVSPFAQVMLFPYAANDTFHTVAERKIDYAALSRTLNCYCIACGSGATGSTASGVGAGQVLFAFDGKVTVENKPFSRESQIVYCDIDTSDVDYLANRNMTDYDGEFEVVETDIVPAPDLRFYPVTSHPFIPQDSAECAGYTASIIEISASALANRMQCSRSGKMVLGVSGGLDSTMALITCVRCCELLNIPASSIVAVSMPGFGTSDRTKDNSLALAELCGAELRFIPISEAVKQHFADIGHDPANTDVVYENSQARERTQILMDIANGCGGLVIGTGDLSEIALGWCTYNGDQMSMYAVNAGIPKTLMRRIITDYAAKCPKALADVLLDVCATPVSPELVPGKQHTEKIIGSYDLHDFYLWHFVKYGSSPEKLLALAAKAFEQVYTREFCLEVLEVFIRRFFTSQFKRTASPDFPDVTGVNLSTGFWNMPSDVSPAFWMAQVEKLKNNK